MSPASPNPQDRKERPSRTRWYQGRHLVTWVLWHRSRSGNVRAANADPPSVPSAVRGRSHGPYGPAQTQHGPDVPTAVGAQPYSQLEKVSGQECSSMGKLCSCSWHSALMVSLRESRGSRHGRPARPGQAPGRAGQARHHGSGGGGWGDHTRDSLWPGSPLTLRVTWSPSGCVSWCCFNRG